MREAVVFVMNNLASHCHGYEFVFFFADPTDFKDEYEAVLMKPILKEDTKAPLIVFPHGGPHVAFTSEFALYSACLCKLGFSVLNGKA